MKTSNSHKKPMWMNKSLLRKINQKKQSWATLKKYGGEVNVRKYAQVKAEIKRLVTEVL
jgi:hypothetical protein